MNRRWLGSLIGLGCVAAVSYTVSIVAATPEQALRRPFSCPGEAVEAKGFQVLTVRKWSKGVVALYRGGCKRDRPVLSYRVVQRNGMEWLLSSTGSRSSDRRELKSNEKKLIEYSVGQPSNTRDRHTVFYGEVLSSSVAAVEVTFDNGKVLRDSGLDGMLLLVASGASRICDVRVLGSDNQILQRDELISTGVAADNHTCQPISGQL